MIYICVINQKNENNAIKVQMQNYPITDKNLNDQDQNFKYAGPKIKKK